MLEEIKCTTERGIDSVARYRVPTEYLKVGTSYRALGLTTISSISPRAQKKKNGIKLIKYVKLH